MDSSLLNILLVEDDQALGAEISSLLKSYGHEVTYCIDGDDAFEAFCNGRHDFCIFDLMLPGIDGFTLTERVRRRDKNIPVLIISKRSHKDDKQKAFDLEVDDYLVKPFELDELIWRVKAINRRLNRPANSSVEEDSTSVGTYAVDFNNQILRNKNHSHRLTRRECEVLKMLTGRKNQLVRREEILMKLWGDVDYFHGRSLDVFISKLRRYLKGDKSLRIDNIPTVGYVLREE